MKIHFLDDDYSTNRYHEITLTEVAEEIGLIVNYFDNPVTLLEEYQKQTTLPDLLFLDINMPIIDGWKFLELYNEKFKDSQTQVVLLTTSHDPRISNQSKTFSNIKEIAIKPLSPENFKEMSHKYGAKIK